MLITPGSERVKIPKKSDCTEVTTEFRENLGENCQ